MHWSVWTAVEGGCMFCRTGDKVCISYSCSKAFLNFSKVYFSLQTAVASFWSSMLATLSCYWNCRFVISLPKSAWDQILLQHGRYYWMVLLYDSLVCMMGGVRLDYITIPCLWPLQGVSSQQRIHMHNYTNDLGYFVILAQTEATHAHAWIWSLH